MPGTCVVSNFSCITPFYRTEQELEICLETCVLVETPYFPTNGTATLCASDNMSMSDKYLKFNYYYKLFELVSATECDDMHLSINNLEKTCIKICPANFYLQEDGECRNVPHCHMD